MNFDYGITTLVLLFLLTCGLLMWYYFCVMLPFSKMPSFRGELPLIRLFLSGDKITTGFCEMFISLGRKYISEGFFILWILKPMVIISNEDYIKEVLSNNLDKAAEYRYMHESLGVGLLTGDKNLSKKRRKMFNPLFRLGMLKEKIDIFNKYSRKLVADLNKMDLTAPVETESSLTMFSFNVMSEAILGLDPEKSSKAYDVELVFKQVHIGTEFFIHRFVKPWLNCVKLFPEGRLYLKTMKEGNEHAKKTLMAMKESHKNMASKIPSEFDYECKSSGKSFLEVLLELHEKDPDFTLGELLDEMKTFIVGGYDTVAGALTWSLFLLGQHPEEQDRAYEEIAYFKDDLSSEDLQDLTYTECVIKESLRLFPPIPLYGRCLERDTKLGKYKIPKRTSVFINVYANHRNPDVFPNPDKFDPSRFLNENSEKKQPSLVGFSLGVRNCIGQNFAMLELKTVVAHLLRKFKIVSEDDYRTVRISNEILLKPDKPIYLKFTPRH